MFENLELALKADKRRAGATLFARLDRGAARPHRRDAGASSASTDARATAPAGLLSHGQKQWLEIGMLLMQDPKLLLLDEPVAGMTDEETERTAELLHVARRASIRWWWSSTTWSSCAASRARVTVLHEGSVLAEGPMDAGAGTTRA